MRPADGILVPAGHSARITDFLVGMLIVVRIPLVASLPTAQLAILALVVLAACRRPVRPLAQAGWYPWLAGALLAYAAIGTLASGIDPLRRTVNIGTLMLMAGFLASGRIDAGSLIKGLSAGLVANAALFSLRLAPDAYAGRLSGYLQDPNAAGLVIAAGSILATLTAQARWARSGILLVGAAGLLATGSRTSTAAYLCAVAWLLGARHLGRAFQIVLGVVAAGVFIWASNSLADDVGSLAGRTGSDALRSRIDAASTEKFLDAPWHGFGLAQGTVQLDGSTWFFNSSYQDLVVEGGFILAVGFLLCFVLAGFGMAARPSVIGIRAWDSRAVAAATLVVFFCASRLGEAFFSPTGFLVLGVGLAHLAVVSQRPPATSQSAADLLPGVAQRDVAAGA
ncbi:hypothetical protein LK09_00455 [Microbacterium mangrovi]|uniref:Uncharacterized protein n=1 Tax=Microbacterium mangrovi TaxID=1348253 RepID=A0A0B2A9M3_9MICO|nr:hypothetical protein [Microbacterium mangrovi]KHK99849.1 hypothetical protein LK09_00455 [Microbacterium mangrovi]